MISEKEANQKAVELCRKLGEGWQPRIWRNLHWCYSADKGGVSVHEYLGNWSAFWMPRSTVVGSSNVSPVDAVLDLQTKYKLILEGVESHYNRLIQVKVGG